MQNNEKPSCLYFKINNFEKYSISKQNRMSIKTPSGYVEIIFDLDENENLIGIEILEEDETE